LRRDKGGEITTGYYTKAHICKMFKYDGEQIVVGKGSAKEVVRGLALWASRFFSVLQIMQL